MAERSLFSFMEISFKQTFEFVDVFVERKKKWQEEEQKQEETRLLNKGIIFRWFAMDLSFYLSLGAKIPYIRRQCLTVVNLTVVAWISGVTVTLVTILPWHAFTMHHAWLEIAEIHGGDYAWSYTTVKSARTTWKFSYENLACNLLFV